MQEFLKEAFQWICMHAEYSSFAFFGLLLLSGLFIPISEDLTIIVAGMVASHCLNPEHFKFLLFMVWLGCLLSAWETYWIGRLLGPKILSLPIIHYFITPKHIKRAEELIHKYGIYSFLVGRFFPGGVRNALFLTSGFSRMPFPIFIMRDLVAGTLTTTVLFSIGYFFGQNLDQIFKWVKELDLAAFVMLLGVILFFFFLRKRYN